MPAKKVSGAKKKAKEEEKKRKKAEKALRPKVDPTFGLKNRKGRANRSAVQNAYNNLNQEELRAQQKRRAQRDAKQARKAAQSKFEDLYRTVDGGSLFETDEAKKRKKKAKAEVKEEKEEKKEELKEEDLTLFDLSTLDPSSPEFEGMLDRIFLAMADKRAKEPDYGTPVTMESLKEWTEERKRIKEEKRKAKTRKKMQKKGKKGLTGRELFSVDESVFIDDAAAEEEYVFEKELTASMPGSLKSSAVSSDALSVPSETIDDENATGVDPTVISEVTEETVSDSTQTAIPSASDVQINDESLFLDADL